MAILPIVEVPDPLLRARSTPVQAVDEAVRAFVADMVETMYDAHGIGLAAPQVGVLERIVVIDLQERAQEAGDADPETPPVRDPRAYINPEILSVSDELSTYNEGCLSIPEQYAEVTRPARCRVAWLDEQGERHEADMDGLMATCMQHEIDHLDGILFVDHVSRLKRDMIMRKLAKARKST